MMDKTFDAVCIGVAIQDIIMPGIPYNAFEYDTCTAQGGFLAVGGDAANEAVVLARLGNHTGLLARVGSDAIGSSIYELLRREPLDLSTIIRDPDARMALAAALIHPDGERSFFLIPGNSSYYLKPEDVTDEILRQTRVVTVGSLYCLPGLDGQPIADILSRAQSFQTITVCDMTHDSFHIGPDAMDCVYPYVDFMMASLEEAVYVTGQTDPEKIADRFLKQGVKNVVVKLGGRGCFFKNGEEAFFSPAFDVQAKDTTGCGDNFVAGFVHGLLRQWTFRDCVKFGSAAGGLNATAPGAHETVKSERQVMDFIHQTPLKSE